MTDMLAHSWKALLVAVLAGFAVIFVAPTQPAKADDSLRCQDAMELSWWGRQLHIGLQGRAVSIPTRQRARGVVLAGTQKAIRQRPLRRQTHRLHLRRLWLCRARLCYLRLGLWPGCGAQSRCRDYEHHREPHFLTSIVAGGARRQRPGVRVQARLDVGLDERARRKSEQCVAGSHLHGVGCIGTGHRGSVAVVGSS